MTHPVPHSSAREDRDIVRSVLPGGLRVVTQHRPGMHGVHLGWFTGIGSRHESLAEHGCSHVLEHVLFKGTARRSAAEISAAVESVGGDLNAWTARDHTAFHARVLRADLDLAVDVLADMLTGSVMREHDLASEKEVILDEIAMHADDPAELAQELAHGALFGDDALGRPVIGTEQSITALTRDQIDAFWHRHYRAGSQVVSVVGDVDHDALVARLGALDLPGGRSVVAESAVTVQPAQAPLVTVSRLAQTSVSLAFGGYARDDDRRFALSVLTTALGGGMSSRLFQRVREDRALAYSIDASDQCWAGAGSASIDWQALPGRTEAIMAEVRAVVDDVRQHGITDAELRAAVNLITGQTLLALDSGSASMSWLGAAWLHDDERTLDEVIGAYQRVTRDEVMAAAHDVLGERPVVAMAGGRSPRAGLLRELARW